MLSRFFLLVVAAHGVLGDKRCIVSDGESEENPTPGTHLLPAAHWDVDQTCVDNLVPIKAEEPCPLYYGVDGQACPPLLIGLEIDEVNQVIVAFGWAQDSESLSIKGEAEWGYWKPQADNPLCSPEGLGPGAGLGPVQTGGSGSAGGSDPGAGDSNTDSGNQSPSPTAPSVPEESDTFGVRPRCMAPADTAYGLPTACLGDYFDKDLDDQQGYVDINSNPAFQAFLAELDPQGAQYGQLTQRAFRSHVRADPWERFRKWAGDRCGSFCEEAGTILKPVLDKFIQWTTLEGSVNENVRFQVPDPSSKITPKDKSITQKDSPWGKALLLKTFKNKEGNMTMWCVGCGVKGNVGIAGRAKWSVTGFSQGEVSLTAFLKIILKIGIDARTTGKQSAKSTIFEQTLSGLNFGVVSIGPSISLGYSTTLRAAAKGRALAGAEMGIEEGKITLDFVRPGRSKKLGWAPFFHPEIKATGAIQVSAELGLPVTLDCGLKISTVLKKTVGITNEPSIKATLQAAASIGQGEGELKGGFKNSKGCKGISHQISWRNKLFYRIFDNNEKTIYDSKYVALLQGCLKQTQGPPRPVAPQLNAGTLEGQTQVTPEIEGPTRENQNATDPSLGELPLAGQQTSPSKRQDDDDPDDPELVDVTDSITGETEVSYPLLGVPSVAYNITDGYQLVPLVDTTASLALVACGNGNIYVINSASESLDLCSKAWQVYNELLVGDASGHVLHYYRNTMSKVGVSRVRASNGADFPSEAVPLVFAPVPARGSGSVKEVPLSQNSTADSGGGDGNSTSTAAAADGAIFVAGDPDFNVYFPVVCTYTTKTPPRLFVVSDPVAGVSMLQSGDVVYSITGGFVDTCVLMPIVQGKYTGDVENEFGEYDDGFEI